MFQWLKKTVAGLSMKSIDVGAILDLLDKRMAELGGGNYRTRIEDGFRRNGVAFSAIRVFYASAAAVRWFAVAVNSSGEDEPLGEGDPYSQLLKRPNPRQGWPRFCGQVILSLLFDGRAYVLRGLGTDGGIKTLNWLRPDLMKPKKPGMDDSDWLYNDEKVFRYDDVLLLTLPNPLDDMCGVGPVEVAMQTIQQGNLSRRWNSRLLANDARPSGILRVKAWISDPAFRKEIIDSFIQAAGGAENAGRPPLVSGDVDWQPTGISPADMQWTQGQIIADRLTATTIGVPSQLLGDKEASTFANYGEARRSLYQETILPLLEYIRSELENWLSPAFPGQGLRLDIDSIDALHEARKDEWSRVAESDWLTLNEKRAATRYEAIDGEGGDLIVMSNGIVIRQDGTVLLPSTMLPIDVAAEATPEPVPAPGQNQDPAPKPGADVPADDTAETEKAPKGPKGIEKAPKGPKGIEKDQEGLKFFIARTNDNPLVRDLHWKAFDFQRARFVNMAAHILAQTFQAERKALVAMVRKGDSVEAIEKAIEGRRPELAAALGSIWRNVGGHFVRQVLNQLGTRKDLDIRVKAPKPKILDLWTREVGRIISEDSSKKITQITDATREKVRNVLRKGFDAELGIDQIADGVDQLYLEQIIPNRSETIARTEVIGSANAGSDFAARSTGLKLKKEWISTRDSRTRDTHAEVNGVTVDMDSRFEVGGAKLRFPGDPLAAAPEETINCRCTVGYIPLD